MGGTALSQLGRNVRAARMTLGLTQSGLAEAIGVSRYSLLRLEAGEYMPAWDEAVRLAGKLKVPLEWLTTGRIHPSVVGLESIAFELHRLGIRDLAVDATRPPGAFRRTEEILTEAIAGDRPEPRVIEAIPFVLARTSFDRHLVLAMYSNDPSRRGFRLRRLGWLADIALTLSGRDGFPPVERPQDLEAYSTIVLEVEKWAGLRPDSLGHPDEANLPPIWRRWNVSYAGRMPDFLRRATELKEAIRNNPVVPEAVA